MPSLTFLNFIKNILAQIPIYYNEVEQTLSPNGRKLGDWFKKNYIGTINRRARFPPSFWSSYSLQSLGSFAHQNFAEAHHKRLNGIVNVHHPSFYKLCDELKKEFVHIQRCAFIHLADIKKQPKSSRNTIRKNAAITHLMEERNNLGKVEYLEAIANSLHLE